MVKIIVGIDAFTPMSCQAVAWWCWRMYRFPFGLHRETDGRAFTLIKKYCLTYSSNGFR